MPLLLLLLWGVIQSTPTLLPSCGTWLTSPDAVLYDDALMCLEIVYWLDSADELAYTALAAGTEGTLYVTSPNRGVVYFIEDTNEDEVPDAPIPLIEGLTQPNALAYHDDALYIGAQDGVYRWQDETLTPIIEDLPAGGALWHGGLAIDDAGWLYVGISAACDGCPPEDSRGVVLRCTLEGDSCAPFALGLRQPLGLAWHDTALWVTDAMHGQADEINVARGGEHFGYPFCAGARNIPIQSDNPVVSCDDYAIAHTFLPSGSTPAALVLYQGEAFPHLQGHLIVLLSGSYNQSRTAGYALLALDPSSGQVEYLVPFMAQGSTNAPHQANERAQNRGEGFFPRRLYGLTISPQGWIYWSAGGGSIYVLRPR